MHVMPSVPRARSLSVVGAEMEITPPTILMAFLFGAVSGGLLVAVILTIWWSGRRPVQMDQFQGFTDEQDCGMNQSMDRIRQEVFEKVWMDQSPGQKPTTLLVKELQGSSDVDYGNGMGGH